MVATLLALTIEWYLYGQFHAAVVAASLDLKTIAETKEKEAASRMNVPSNIHSANYVMACSNRTLHVRYELTGTQRSELSRDPWWQSLVKPKFLRPGRVILTDADEVFWLHESGAVCQEMRL